MQIVENKRTTLFHDSATDMIAPGIAAGVAAARQIIVRQLFVILRQQRVIQRLIAVLMHQHGGRHPRLDVRVIRRPAKAKTEQRQDVQRQLQQLGHRLDAVAQPADIDATQPEGLGGGQRVLRQQRRIDNADQQLFRQPQLRLRADLQVAVKVGAEDPKLRRTGDVLLAAGQRDQTFTQGRVGNTDDGGAL